MARTHQCGCPIQPWVIWDAGAGTGSYCPSCGASLRQVVRSDDEPIPVTLDRDLDCGCTPPCGHGEYRVRGEEDTHA